MLSAVGALGSSVGRIPAPGESAALEAQCRDAAPRLPALAVKDVLTGLRGVDADVSPLTLFALGRRLEATRPKFPRDDLFLDALEAFLLLGGAWEPERQQQQQRQHARSGDSGDAGGDGGRKFSVAGAGSGGAGGSAGGEADPNASDLWPVDI